MSVKNKRNIFGVLLICLLVIPTLTTISWLHYQKKEIKRDVKNKIMSGLSSDELVELNFSFEELLHLKWKKKHEFEFQGKMYDIVYRKNNRLEFTYWCWLDKEETALNAKLDNLLQIALSTNNNRKSKELQLDTFLKSMIFLTCEQQSLSPMPNSEQNDKCIHFIDDIDLKITSPPPEIA